MKDLQYITHDLGARNDPKLLMLQMEMGGQGLAIFWCLVEMLWENDGRMPLNTRAIAFSLRWATPDEVERVVKEFGLFEDDGTEFWSRSALERIAQKKDRIQARSESARLAGQASARARSTSAQQPLNERSTDVELRNKYINKERKKDSNNNTPLTAADFFEIFFFRNVKDPAGEAKRFIDYYEERGWKHLDGTPVTDPERAALDWKPAAPDKRFNEEALRWYRGVWRACRNQAEDQETAKQVMLESLAAIRVKGNELAVVYRDEKSARWASSFILINNLSGDWKLNFRVLN